MVVKSTPRWHSRLSTIGTPCPCPPCAAMRNLDRRPRRTVVADLFLATAGVCCATSSPPASQQHRAPTYTCRACRCCRCHWQRFGAVRRRSPGTIMMSTAAASMLARCHPQVPFRRHRPPNTTTLARTTNNGVMWLITMQLGTRCHCPSLCSCHDTVGATLLFCRRFYRLEAVVSRPLRTVGHTTGTV